MNFRKENLFITLFYLHKIAVAFRVVRKIFLDDHPELRLFLAFSSSSQNMPRPMFWYGLIFYIVPRMHNISVHVLFKNPLSKM